MMGQITPKHFGDKKKRTDETSGSQKNLIFFLKFKLKKKQLADSSGI